MTEYTDIDVEQAFDAVMDYLKDVYGDRRTITEDVGKMFARGAEMMRKALELGEIP